MSEPIFVGKSDQDVFLLPAMSNRHGLIAGATGTGKTVTLQILAEQFSAQGVPVFMADVKGDLSGMSQPGGGKPKLEERAAAIGLPALVYEASPVVFWDVFGESGHRLRATVSEMGPLLLARIMDLNDTQEGVLNIAFRVAEDHGYLLLDLKDLRAMLAFVSDQADSIEKEYGLVSAASVGAIQRGLLMLEEQGADEFFGEPALRLDDLIQTDGGKGVVNILAADKLLQNPRLYTTFLLWLMSELFEQLPEVGDLDKPKLAFFFDEAHLLFNDAPKALLEKVEQVVKLVRSKGVGVFFVTQNPLDIPDSVLAQLSNRFQHALRAFTPRDQKAVSAAADTFRQNPKFKTEEVITQLVVGEALVSTLDEKGMPTLVQRTLIRPPLSRLGPITIEERKAVMARSLVAEFYGREIDRESAYELLSARAAEAAKTQEAIQEDTRRPAPARRTDSLIESLAKSTLRSVGASVGRAFVRGILGAFKRK